jgi:hypothetical protein
MSNWRNRVLAPAEYVFRRRSVLLDVSTPKEGFALCNRKQELSVAMAVSGDANYKLLLDTQKL